MKKILLVLFSLCIIFGFSGCSFRKDSQSTPGKGQNGGGDGETNSQSQKVSHYDSRTKKISDGIKKEDSIATSNDLFVMYYLGELKNVYVDSLILPIKNTGGQKMNYSYSKMSTTTISNGIRNCVTQSNIVSSSQNSTISAGLSIPIKAVAINIDASFQYTKLNTTTIEKTNENTYEKIVSEAKSYTGEYHVNLDNYEKNLYYTFGLFADVKIYQIIEYDLDKEEINSYLVSVLDNSVIDITCSEDNSFNLNNDLKLSAIKQIDKESLSNIIKNAKKVNNILFNNTMITDEVKVNSSEPCDIPFLLNQKLNALSKLGFEKIKIKISFEMKEINRGYQLVKIYSTKGILTERQYEHGGSGNPNKTYKLYTIELEVGINDPNLGEELYVGFTTIEDKRFDDWYVKNVNILVEALWN